MILAAFACAVRSGRTNEQPATQQTKKPNAAGKFGPSFNECRLTLGACISAKPCGRMAAAMHGVSQVLAAHGWRWQHGRVHRQYENHRTVFVFVI